MTVVDETEQHDEADLPPAQERKGGGWHSGAIPLEKSKDFGGSIRRLGLLLKPEWHMVSVVGVIAVTSAVLNVFGPRVLGHGTDIIVKGV
ncbi:MAG: ATP-binding cassette, subfamily multidrug efflux pump, partial [Acidimicrobiaceae bacterium]